MTPKISVLLPTRERVDRLDKCLLSLGAMADNQAAVEVVLRVDDDDRETLDYLGRERLNYLCGPRLNGYASLATMINEAAAQATADLLIVINDDVEFKTPGWDTKLTQAAAQYPDGIFDLGVNTVLNNPNFVFPCQSRRQVEILGCFYDPRLIYTDIWLRDVLQPFGRAIRVDDVTIEHQWAGMSVDQQQAAAIVGTSPIYAALYTQCVEEGRAKIRAALPC